MSKTSIKQNKILFIGACCMLVYSIIEITDCIFILLIALNLAPNLYLEMGIPESGIMNFLENQPILLFPFFLTFTLMRITSTYGLFKNRQWGFYIGIVSLVVTMILTMNFIPIGFIEILMCAILVIVLMIGFFGNKPLIE